jgi:hypothetical protein
MKKQKIILKWLNKGFGNLNIVVKGNRTYYADENNFPLFYYYQIQKIGRIYTNYDRIWSLLESVFNMNDLEISKLLKVWLEDTYNLGGYTPSTFDSLGNLCWKKPII